MKAKWIDVSDENSGRPAWRCAIAESREIYDNPLCTVSFGLTPRGTWRVLFMLDCTEGRHSDNLATEAEALEIATALVEVFERMWP